MPIATVAIDRGTLEPYVSGLRDVHVVMEACGTAHYWGRKFEAMSLRVSLLPPHYVRPYVRRNKTDSADAAALLERAGSAELKGWGFAGQKLPAL